jgi:hypothetical protein
VKAEIYLQNETIWLTQQKIADLFGMDRTVATKHISNIFKSDGLNEQVVFPFWNAPLTPPVPVHLQRVPLLRFLTLNWLMVQEQDYREKIKLWGNALQTCSNERTVHPRTLRDRLTA